MQLIEGRFRRIEKPAISSTDSPLIRMASMMPPFPDRNTCRPASLRKVDLHRHATSCARLDAHARFLDETGGGEWFCVGWFVHAQRLLTKTAWLKEQS